MGGLAAVVVMLLGHLVFQYMCRVCTVRNNAIACGASYYCG